jgi:hypothetical protein
MMSVFNPSIGSSAATYTAPTQKFEPKIVQGILIPIKQVAPSVLRTVGPAAIEEAAPLVAGTLEAQFTKVAAQGGIEIVKLGGQKIFNQKLMTEIGRTLSPLRAPDLSNGRLMMSLFGGIKVGEVTLGQLAVRYGVSMAALAASVVAEKQAKSMDENNFFTQYVVPLSGGDWNKVPRAFRYAKIRKELLQKYTKAEQEWKKAHPEGVATKPQQSKPVNMAKLMADLGKLGLSPQKIDKLLKPLKPAQLIKMQELSPWLHGEVFSGRMTYEKAIEITERTANATYRDSLFQGGPTEPDPPPRNADGCYISGEFTVYSPQVNRLHLAASNYDFNPPLTAYRPYNGRVITEGRKNGIPATQTKAEIRVNDVKSRKNFLKIDTGTVQGIAEIRKGKDELGRTIEYDNHHGFNGFVTGHFQELNIEVAGVCVFSDGTTQLAEDRVRKRQTYGLIEY